MAERRRKEKYTVSIKMGFLICCCYSDSCEKRCVVVKGFSVSRCQPSWL